MSHTRKDLDALKIALKTEEEGYRLYKTASEGAKNELDKSIFTRLLKDEVMHMTLIKNYYAHLQKSDSWSDLPLKDKDYNRSKVEMKTIFSRALEKAKSGELDVGETDTEIYKKAVDFERYGVELYDRLYNETEDDIAKKFYIFLREMEQEHLDLLDSAMQYLKNPDNWYLLEEGWTLDD